MPTPNHPYCGYSEMLIYMYICLGESGGRELVGAEGGQASYGTLSTPSDGPLISPGMFSPGMCPYYFLHVTTTPPHGILLLHTKYTATLP